RAARGPKDAGHRAAHRRHRARLQQPAAGHPREPGVRTSQARRRRQAAAADRASGLGGPARGDADRAASCLRPQATAGTRRHRPGRDHAGPGAAPAPHPGRAHRGALRRDRRPMAGHGRPRAAGERRPE
ncbi:hypothetical protein QP62_00050, partial [Staphylococcus aureus]